MNEQTTNDEYQGPTRAELDEDEVGWRESCTQYMREKEAECLQKGYCFSWIDPEPTFCPASDYSLLFTKDGNYDIAFPNPDEPCTRILRFSLLGGGQIRAIEDFVESSVPGISSWPGERTWNRNKIKLKITAHVGDSIVTAMGDKYEGEHYEMNAQAVVLYGRRQDLADRVAATFRLIDNDADNFFALMDGSEGCAICGRALRDEISKLIGVGPECASKYGVPHSRQAAEKRLELRKKLLGESK
jgi:hypothetical protein